MADTARLEAELEVAKLCDQLEEAREAMHAKRGSKPSLERDDPAMVAYNEASDKVAAAREAFRIAYPPPEPAEGDGQAKPDTHKVKLKVDKPGGAK